MLSTVVIEVGMFGDSESNVSPWKHRHVVCVSIVKSVISCYEWNFVGFCPAHANKPNEPRCVCVNDIKFILAKSPKHSPKGRICNRIAFAQRSFYGPETMCIRIIFTKPKECRSEYMNRVTTVSQFLNKQINTNANSIQNWQ